MDVDTSKGILEGEWKDTTGSSEAPSLVLIIPVSESADLHLRRLQRALSSMQGFKVLCYAWYISMDDATCDDKHQPSTTLSRLRSKMQERFQKNDQAGEEKDIVFFGYLCLIHVRKGHLRQAALHGWIQDWLGGVGNIDPSIIFGHSAPAKLSLGSSSTEASHLKDPIDDDDILERLTNADNLKLTFWTFHDDLIKTGHIQGSELATADGQPYQILPLHDKEFNKILIREWSTKWQITIKDMIKITRHFGEEVSIYFAFLRHYFIWLTVPAVIGLYVSYSSEAMITPWYSLVLLLWSMVFLETWQLQQESFAIYWNIQGCSQEVIQHQHRIRLGFRPRGMEKDAVTGKMVPYYPRWLRFTKTTLVVLPIVLLFVIGFSVWLGLIFFATILCGDVYAGPFPSIMRMVPSIVNSVTVPYVSKWYFDLAQRLTEFENFEIERDYINSLATKIFLSKFIMNFLSFFAITFIYVPYGPEILGFMQQKLPFNLSIPNLRPGFDRLRQEIVYFIVSAQFVDFIRETIAPMLSMRAATIVAKPTHPIIYPVNIYHDEAKGSTEDTSHLISKVALKLTSSDLRFLRNVKEEHAMERYTTYNDYAEMASQFGSVIMFSIIWPLAPVAAFINNWVELRSDFVKVCEINSRPIPFRVETIGPWFGILKLIVHLAIVTNTAYFCLFHECTWPYGLVASNYLPLPVSFLPSLCSEGSTSTVGWFFVNFAMAEIAFIVFRSTIRLLLKDVFPSQAILYQRKKAYELKQTFMEALRSKNPPTASTLSDKKDN